MRILFAVSLALSLCTLRAAQVPAASPSLPSATADASSLDARLSATDAITLGVVEGVTEFLPVSSTGHLILVMHWLGLESEQPLKGRDGQTLWYRKPSAKYPGGVPLTEKLAADTFTVVIQFGAIAAVGLLYWRQFLSMISGLLGRDPAGLRLLVHVLIAFFPAALVGLIAHDWLEARLFAPVPIAIAQIVGAVVMLYAEAWRRRHTATKPVGQARTELTTKSAAGIGALQVFSLWPGMSRSMTTIVGGYFAGLEPKRAAEFSFVLGFVTLTAASLYKGYKSGAAMIQVFGWPHVLLGGFVAAVTAAVCVKFLVHWLTRHGLAIFAAYRFVVAAVILGLFYLGK